MFNRSEILRSAWELYRRDDKAGFCIAKGFRRNGPFDREHFGYCLSTAWAIAKDRAAKAEKLAPAAVPAVVKALSPAAAERATAIRSELEAMSYSNFIPWARHDALSAELARLSA